MSKINTHGWFHIKLAVPKQNRKIEQRQKQIIYGAPQNAKWSIFLSAAGKVWRGISAWHVGSGNHPKEQNLYAFGTDVVSTAIVGSFIKAKTVITHWLPSCGTITTHNTMQYTAMHYDKIIDYNIL